MSLTEATVFVVDDDSLVRRSLERLLGSAGWRSQGYASGQEFLNDYNDGVPGCLLLDMKLPGQTGLELQRSLGEAGCCLPIIFLTGFADVPTTVEAMKAGAMDLLTKPWAANVLLKAVDKAVQADLAGRCERAELEEIGRSFGTLTPREQEVCQLVVTGLLNKQVAHELGVKEKTVKVHRARVMRKMGVESLAELVHLVERLGLGLAGR